MNYSELFRIYYIIISCVFLNVKKKKIESIGFNWLLSPVCNLQYLSRYQGQVKTLSKIRSRLVRQWKYSRGCTLHNWHERLSLQLCCTVGVQSQEDGAITSLVPQCWWWMSEWVCSTNGMITTEKSRSTRSKRPSHNAILPAKNSVCTEWQVQSQASPCGLCYGQSEEMGQSPPPFLRILPFSPVTIIPSIPHPPFFCHRHYVIIAVDNVFK